jgi:hypothetical protein
MLFEVNLQENRNEYPILKVRYCQFVIEPYKNDIYRLFTFHRSGADEKLSRKILCMYVGKLLRFVRIKRLVLPMFPLVIINNFYFGNK